MRRILDHPGQPYSTATDQTLDRFLAENPKGTHSLVEYRMEDLGIDSEERRQALEFYRRRFGVDED